MGNYHHIKDEDKQFLTALCGVGPDVYRYVWMLDGVNWPHNLRGSPEDCCATCIYLSDLKILANLNI